MHLYSHLRLHFIEPFLSFKYQDCPKEIPHLLPRARQTVWNRSYLLRAKYYWRSLSDRSD